MVKQNKITIEELNIKSCEKVEQNYAMAIINKKSFFIDVS